MRTAPFVVVLGLVIAAPTANAQEAQFKLVANAANGVSSITRDEATQYFLKKKATWPGGQAVLPVDQSDDSPVRLAFSKVVLRKDVGAVQSYWQSQIFAGRGVPPPEQPSDEGVIAFVKANAGAIGYVSGGAAVGRGLKEVEIN